MITILVSAWFALMSGYYLAMMIFLGYSGYDHLIPTFVGIAGLLHAALAGSVLSPVSRTSSTLFVACGVWGSVSGLVSIRADGPLWSRIITVFFGAAWSVVLMGTIGYIFSAPKKRRDEPIQAAEPHAAAPHADAPHADAPRAVLTGESDSMTLIPIEDV